MAKESITDAPEGGRNARSKAKARPRKRGRTIVALLLVGFVLVASAVVWRRIDGITHVRRLNELDRKLTQLESERTHLAGMIRDESSRSRLEPIVDNLGMQVPSDQQVRILTR
jgi:cell division protein FtsL